MEGTGLAASVGEASFPQDGQTVEDLLSEADRRMYLAKRKPRLVRIPAPAALQPQPARVPGDQGSVAALLHVVSSKPAAVAKVQPEASRA